MDPENLATHIRSRFDHQANRRVIREKYQAKLVLGYRGGLFRCTPENMVFLTMYRDQDIVMLDSYENPIKIDATELLELMQQRWQEQMNAWYQEYQLNDQQR